MLASERLLMKLSGFLSSCAMPEVRWARDASFSDWMS